MGFMDTLRFDKRSNFLSQAIAATTFEASFLLSESAHMRFASKIPKTLPEKNSWIDGKISKTEIFESRWAIIQDSRHSINIGELLYLFLKYSNY